jgi:hypothetical protein
MRCLFVEPGTGGPRELRPHPQSLLRWSNPEIGRVYGDVFVWTDSGRPAAIVSMYRFYVPWQSLNAEFLALRPAPGLSVERDGQRLWAPQSGGVEWRPVPDAPVPARSHVARLRQMRLLAGRFSAALTDRRSDTSGDIKQLRLLTQPVFRYSAADAGKETSGALFAFVIGTDPEVFVLVEAREDGRALQWQYAIARMNRDPIEVRLDGKAVWSAPYLDPKELKDSQRPYCCVELPLPNDES